MSIGPTIEVGQYSDAGPKAENQDSYGVVMPSASLLQTKGIAIAIADGMSSCEAAKMASETCVKSFLEDYYCTHESWTVKRSAAAVLNATNRWLYGQGQRQAVYGQGMVSTFTGVVLKGGIAHIFHVGDSRVALMRSGTLEPITREHRVRVAGKSDYLARAIGILPDLDVDYHQEEIQSGDFLVLTTDGVHDFVSDILIADIIQEEGEDITRAARRVVESALEAGSDDNTTCQIIRVTAPGRIDEQAHLAQLARHKFAPDLSPGDLFEGYRVLAELHASNRTQVYLALDLETERKVILKTPSVNFDDDPAYIEMFTREEWVGRQIKSPHVAAVLEAKSARKHLYYATEFVEGNTLREWMAAHPRPTHEQICSIISQISVGLRAFHRKDILHRDIKPENIVIDQAGTAKIIDFGSSLAGGLDELGTPVEMPTLTGTVGYTAPELHLGQLATKRSDLFSLGVIAYEMATGRLPYKKGFMDAKSAKTLKPVPASQYNPDIPAWMSAALAKATAREPAERYDALSAFVMDLARPNSTIVPTGVRPLLERDPILFWRVLAIFSLVVNAILFGTWH
ncbi:MAG: protein kinase [Rhodobiaceae bacterium]|nr:MAG: protein kinase [Rhodobiaceae bacterium]